MPRSEVSFLLFKRHVEETFSAVERSDLSHFISGQLKVENIEVFLHMPRIRCSGEDDRTLLNMPAENDLHIGLAVFLSQFREYSFTDKTLIAVTDRIPALDDSPVSLDTLFQSVLLIVRVALDLQNGGLDRCRFADLLKAFALKVADTDRLYLVCLNSLLHVLPGTEIIAELLMQQEKVDI